MMNKKAQSDIISTILLILLSIVAISIIIGIVIPLVKDKLEESKKFDVVGKLEISPDYTCYNGSAMQVQVQILEVSEAIDGFVVELGESSSQTYKIRAGSADVGVVMCKDTDPITLPQDNGRRTYVITSSKPSVVRLYPILKNGDIGDLADVVTEIELCPSAKRC